MREKAFTLAENQQADFHIADKGGFTLAEVLITLVIIGVIAALTIPTLMQNINEKATVTKLKKVFTTLNNATLAAVAENGSIDTWDFVNTNSTGALAKEFNDKIKPFLKISKDCGVNTDCFPNIPTKFLGSDKSMYSFELWKGTYYSHIILADGELLATYIPNKNCTSNLAENSIDVPLNKVCGWIYVDIDGYGGMATAGKDTFQFNITKCGQLFPSGVPEDTADKLSESCNTTEGNGVACTAWIIYKENMDYLKGKTVAW